MIAFLKKYGFALALVIVSVAVLALYMVVPDARVVVWTVLPIVLMITAIAWLVKGREGHVSGSPQPPQSRNPNSWGIFTWVFGLAGAAFATLMLATIITVVTGFSLELTTLKQLTSIDDATAAVKNGVTQVITDPRDITSLRIIWGVVFVAGSVFFGFLVFLGGKRRFRTMAGLMVAAVLIALPFIVSLESRVWINAHYQKVVSKVYKDVVATQQQAMDNMSNTDEDLARGRDLPVRRIVYDTVGFDKNWQEVAEVKTDERIRVNFAPEFQRQLHLNSEVQVLVHRFNPKTKMNEESFYVPVSAVERRLEELKQPVDSRVAQAITEAPKYEPAKWYIPNSEDLDKETRLAVAEGSLIVWATDLQSGQMSEAHRFSTRKLGVTGYHMERSKGLPLFITINGETDFLPSGEDPELPTIYNVGDFQVSVPDSAEFGGNVRLLLHTN